MKPKPPTAKEGLAAGIPAPSTAGPRATKQRLAQLRGESAAHIAESLCERVASGRLAPGLHLGQDQLAQEFKVARTVVREALRFLVAEGLVVHDPYRGFFLDALSTDEARQLFTLRGLLEDALLADVRWPTRPEMAAFRRRVRELERLPRASEHFEWFQRHREFHWSIFELSRAKVIAREAARLWSQAARYRSVLSFSEHPSFETAVRSRRDILEALRDRDTGALRAARARCRRYFAERVFEGLAGRCV